MTSPIRAIMVGLGVHGQEIARAVTDAGIEITAAVDPAFAGQDVGAVVEWPGLAGLHVAGDLSEVPAGEHGAHITLVAAKLPVPKLVPLMRTAVERGTDVLTIVEDAFDLQTLDPELHAELDAAARAAGKTVVATGVQDVGWVGLVLQATTLQHRLDGLHLRQHLGVDGYPEDFLRWVGIGSTPEEFDRAAEEAGRTPSVFGGILPVIARSLGLTVTGQSRQMSPFTLEEPLESRTLGRAIAAGDPAGRSDVVTVRTAEGIDLVAELVTSGVMGRDDFEAVLEGHPRVELRHRLEPSNLAVNATLVNRIPDVLAAPAGLVATVDLPTPRLRRTPLRAG